MRPAEVRRRRLISHRLSPRLRLDDPEDVVRHLGAVQAQDSRQALWAIGARLKRATAARVEKAVEDARIVRTWPMRGTIHAVAPEDVRWMLELGVPRMRAGMAGRLRELDVTPQLVDRAGALLEPLLADGPCTRAALMAALEANGIATGEQRGVHLLMQLAMDALICPGPVREGAQTFVLLETWVPPSRSRKLDRDAALADLAGRYARSRGPVTAQDLARWAGQTVAAATAGLTDASGLRTVVQDRVRFWLAEDQPEAPPPRNAAPLMLLAGFDEYLLGYKGRDDVIAPSHFEKVVPGRNGIFKPMLVRDGEIVGTWTRTSTARKLTVTLAPFHPEDADELRAAAPPAVARYRTFLGLPASLPTVVDVG